MGLQRILLFILIIVLLGVFSIYYPALSEKAGITWQTASLNEEYPKEQAVLLRVIDGDTIEVIFAGSEEKESIRMLGINNPIV